MKLFLSNLSLVLATMLLSCNGQKNAEHSQASQKSVKVKDSSNNMKQPENQNPKSQDELLKAYLKQGKMSKEELMEEAKKRNIPFRKETNGVTYELQGFDKETGMPMYYSAGPAITTPALEVRGN